ncbi:prepilin-type N-terminal cleavage/methylation domain-containing protein [Stenotrophomonas mori]|uniref:Prepilin-type N-terminal cleavage/methylation domain-containing protein n=1 Tax=Stenotrophomonas mori TaxID=2871096 RepID=A0ABT0SIQ8_9GAMM|nr:prepilin-type N-terminal cleavage/methylation domain-containing protein [Stenotrophomonas mori]MCL7715147.1 prepilin-type N-terminal cleavage/methylation domain-containing protein [Stenotrophomonas mori]
MNRAARSARGFSLVELAVALAIAALLTVLVFSLLPLGNQVLDAERQQQELAQAEQALLGYMRSQGRLPAADGDGDGRADGATDGWLPVDDLGLPSRMRLYYQVERGLTGTLPADLFDPVLPASDQPAAERNGLDLCMRLLLNQRATIGLGGLDLPVAYYLGHSGIAGHGRIEAAAQWQPSAQAMPGTAAGQLATVAAGPGELATRLSCPDRLARAQGSAQTAYAAYSALRMTAFNLEFREFDILIAETIREQARVARDLAAYALAEAITNEAIALVMVASGWPPDGITMSAGAKKLAEAIMSIKNASEELAGALETYDDAVAGVHDAEHRRTLVETFRLRIEQLYEDARDTAIGLDRAGLNP